jgi:hypothetical protein
MSTTDLIIDNASTILINDLAHIVVKYAIVKDFVHQFQTSKFDLKFQYTQSCVFDEDRYNYIHKYDHEQYRGDVPRKRQVFWNSFQSEFEWMFGCAQWQLSYHNDPNNIYNPVLLYDPNFIYQLKYQVGDNTFMDKLQLEFEQDNRYNEDLHGSDYSDDDGDHYDMFVDDCYDWIIFAVMTRPHLYKNEAIVYFLVNTNPKSKFYAKFVISHDCNRTVLETITEVADYIVFNYF